MIGVLGADQLDVLVDDDDRVMQRVQRLGLGARGAHPSRRLGDDVRLVLQLSRASATHAWVAQPQLRM